MCKFSSSAQMEDREFKQLKKLFGQLLLEKKKVKTTLAVYVFTVIYLDGFIVSIQTASFKFKLPKKKKKSVCFLFMGQLAKFTALFIEQNGL